MSRTYATRHEVLAAPDKKTESGKPKEGHRETVEAIVVAMILALLVRGFEAEAFVIPTGSMAPTLMGRHKEITCPQCGFVYAVNASEEVEGVAAGNTHSRRVHSGICVNCRFQAPVADAPSFKGDRILVMKFPYDLSFLPGSSSPQRWDVVVFRYPEEPEVSYIKRLVGLPGEELSIYFGDVYLRQPGSKEYQLARKPLSHLQAMQMMVYDDSHRPDALKKLPEWRRWTASTPVSGWTEVVDPGAPPGHFKLTTASVKGQDPTVWSELRYRNLVPDPEQWDAIIAGRVLPRPPRPTLITAFYSYNTNLTAESSGLVDYPRDDQAGAWMQPEWVGDLSISVRLTVTSPKGRVRFELVEGGVLNHCSIDLDTGKATLYHDNRVIGEQSCRISEAGVYHVSFANIDERLTLVVDGRGVFGDGVTYEVSEKHAAPTAADLAPVAIAAQGDAEIELSDLVLKRDIYYTLYPGRSDYSQSWDQRFPRTPVELFDMLSDPSQFPALGSLRWSRPYLIGPDSYLMLGDNSPRSKDSRGWDNRDRYDPEHPDYGGWDTTNRASWEVPRSLLTGKAFFVYWPHGKPIGPDIRLKRDFQVPFRPYVERMKWIR